MRNISLNSYSFFTPIGGYGVLNLQWATQLQKAGIKVFPSMEYAPVPGTREWEILEKDERELFQKPFELQKIGISGTTPFEFRNNTSKVRIAMTMAESDHIGGTWVRACNAMDWILVPNDFYREVFISSGVTVPVTVIPNGVHTQRYPYFDRPEREVFTFGICGYLNDRKGAKEVVQAFVSEFAPHEPVRLKLHTSCGLFRYYGDFKDPRISLSWDHKSFAELNDWYRSLDCFVFPSKAEGIGYPPREAMSTGLPTILTDYSGLSDVANPTYAFPLDVARFDKRTDMLEQPGNWAEIDVQQLMYQMRWVYEHQEKAKRRGKLASEHMEKKYGWDKCVKRFTNFLEDHFL